MGGYWMGDGGARMGVRLKAREGAVVKRLHKGVAGFSVRWRKHGGIMIQLVRWTVAPRSAANCVFPRPWGSN
ncbi:hypothetical protein V6N11_001521 [Hibiscus sabdariffa]